MTQRFIIRSIEPSSIWWRKRLDLINAICESDLVIPFPGGGDLHSGWFRILGGPLRGRTLHINGVALQARPRKREQSQCPGCPAYSFPHRAFSGKCKGEPLFDTVWEEARECRVCKHFFLDTDPPTTECRLYTSSPTKWALECPSYMPQGGIRKEVD